MSKTNFQSFPSALFFSFSMYIKHLFVLSIQFQSHLIRHSVHSEGTQTFKALRKHSGTLALKGHPEGTQRALGQLESTRSAPRNSRHLRHLDTQTLRALRHLRYSGIWSLGNLATLGTQALGHLRHLGTRGTLFSRFFIYESDKNYQHDELHMYPENAPTEY